jgi:hypothetical protein
MTDENTQNEGNQQEAVLLVFANNKDETQMGVLKGLLKMAYHTVLTNRLAIMEALNSETGEPELVLVGIEQNGAAMNCFPLFKPLKAEDVAKYHAPDGQGGWIKPNE